LGILELSLVLLLALRLLLRVMVPLLLVQSVEESGMKDSCQGQYAAIRFHRRIWLSAACPVHKCFIGVRY
jgi:hypothetical protein